MANWFKQITRNIQQGFEKTLILNPVTAPIGIAMKASSYFDQTPGNFVVVSYDTRGNNAIELGRYSVSGKAIARADLAGAYSAVVFDIDYKIPFYFNAGSDLQTSLSVGTSPGDFLKFIASGGLLNPPPNLQKIFDFAKSQGYWDDTYEEWNRRGEEITKRLNQLIRS